MESDVHSQKISTASQTCDSFLSKEEAEKLREQIKEKEAEIDQLKAQLEKLQLVPRAPTSDESRQYAPSSSHNETSLSGRLLVDEVSLKSQPVEDNQRTVGRSECDPDCSSKTGNQLRLQQNSKKHDQLTERSHEPDASHSSDRKWERQGARPKLTQMQFPVGVGDKRSHNANLNLEGQSSQFGEKEPILGSFPTSDTVVESVDLLLPWTVSSSTVSSTMVVSNSTSWLSLAVASNITSTVLDTKGNSVSSPTVEGDGSEESSSGKLQLLPRAPTRDESRQDTANSACNETSLHTRLHVKGASLKRQPEFQCMKDLAKGKVNEPELARMRIPYQLLDELEKGSGHPCTDIRELLESIQRHDLLEKLGVSLHEGIAAVSPESSPLKDKSLNLLSSEDDKKEIVPRRSHVSVRSSARSGEVDDGRTSGIQKDNSSASFLSFESSAGNEREIPASRDTEDYEGLPLESVTTDGKEDTDVSFSSDEAGPSSILSSTSSNSSDSLVLNSAEGVPVTCLRGGSPGSCEETEPTEMFLATESGFSDGITSGKTSLNAGSFEDEIPQEAHSSDSEHNVTDVGANNETVVDDMQGTSVESCNEESTLNCWSGPRASPVLVESYSGLSSTGNPPLWPSSTPVFDGLEKDFLARHSQDRSILQSLYTDDRGLISASEAYSERPCFGAMGAPSYERLGGAFSDVPSGGSVARAGFLGGSFHNESSYSSSTHNTAAPLPSFTGQTHFPSVWNGMSSYGVNTSNPSLLPPNYFANRNHSLTGGQNFSREWDSFLDQNFRGSRLSLQQINTLISPNPRFVYGSTSLDFAAEIHPAYSLYGAQRHVLSDGNSALIDDQRSHNSNLNLGASEQRTAEDASAQVERRLRGREEREEFMRELQRKEQMIREEREGRENDDMGWQEAIPRRKPDLVENVCNAT